MIRGWVVIGLVVAIVGVPGAVTARYVSLQASASEASVHSAQLGSVKGLSVAAVCGENSAPVVTVQWNGSNSGLTDGFEIRRQTIGAVGFQRLDGVSGRATRYADPAVAPRMTYIYSIQAMNAAWTGKASTTPAVTVPSCA